MRAFIIATLDVLAVLLVIVFTLGGVVAGFGAASGPYVAEVAKIALPILGLVGGFASGALISGSILALTEIARNTRRTVDLLEKIAGR